MEQILEEIAEFVNKCLGPLGSEGFSGSTIRDFIIQIIATIILFLAVRFLFWKPITNILESRKSIIDKELAEAKTAREQAVILEEQLKTNFEESKLRIKELLANAQKEGLAEKETIIEEAKAEAKRKIQNANLEIDLEIKKQYQQIKEEIISIAFNAAEAIVKKEIDQQKYLKLVDDIIDSGLKSYE